MKLIKFGARWCAPCHAMEPVIKKFEAKHPDIEVERADIDKLTAEQAALAKKLRIQGVPFCVFLDEKGRVCAKLYGLAALKDLEAALRRARRVDKKRRKKPTRAQVLDLGALDCDDDFEED